MVGKPPITLGVEAVHRSKAARKLGLYNAPFIDLPLQRVPIPAWLGENGEQTAGPEISSKGLADTGNVKDAYRTTCRTGEGPSFSFGETACIESRF